MRACASRANSISRTFCARELARNSARTFSRREHSSHANARARARANEARIQMFFSQIDCLGAPRERPYLERRDLCLPNAALGRARGVGPFRGGVPYYPHKVSGLDLSLPEMISRLRSGDAEPLGLGAQSPASGDGRPGRSPSSVDTNPQPQDPPRGYIG